MNMSIPTSNNFENLEGDQLKSFKDFLVFYNKLAEICFNDCVDDFTSRKIKTSEDRCALNCIEKFIKVNQRINQRFQEFQLLANENTLATAQKLSQGSS